MATDFVFQPPSDEEIDYVNDDTDDSGSETEETDPENEENPQSRIQKSKQTPWDFSLSAKSVDDKLASRKTTSVDFKISKVIQQRSAPFTIDNDQENSDDDEPHRQVSYILFS